MHLRVPQRKRCSREETFEVRHGMSSMRFVEADRRLIRAAPHSGGAGLRTLLPFAFRIAIKQAS
jgi:hypothetical protein